MSNVDKAEYALEVFSELNENDPDAIKKAFQKKSKVNSEKFEELFNKFVDMHEHPEKYEGIKTKTKGNILEQIIQVLTVNTNVFETFINPQNSSNEFDLFITPSKVAKVSYNAFPDVIMQPIICECKNYGTTVSVTWIGKLYMLLSQANIKIGILFSYEGITGVNRFEKCNNCKSKEWSDAIGLIKKIYLKDQIAIIVISKDELLEIKNGTCLYDVIDRKYKELQLLTNIENCKIDHDCLNNIQPLLQKINDEVSYYKDKKYVVKK